MVLCPTQATIQFKSPGMRATDGNKVNSKLLTTRKRSLRLMPFD